MPLPDKIAAIKNKPGKYLVWGRNHIWFLRVANDSTIYQLSPRDLGDDGALDDEGWNHDAIANKTLYSLTKV